MRHKRLTIRQMRQIDYEERRLILQNNLQMLKDMKERLRKDIRKLSTGLSTRQDIL